MSFEPHSKAAIYKDTDGAACIVTANALDVEVFGENVIFSAAVPEGVDFEVIELSVIDEMYAKYGSIRDAWYVDISTASGKGSQFDSVMEVASDKS